MVVKVMGNHCYCGALAKICMLSWSRQFPTNITTALATITITCFQLYILRFYGDDTIMVVKELESRYREGRVVD